MKQVSNKGKTLVSKPKKKRTVSKVKKTTRRTVRVHPKFGTSKLEEDFARDFLDKLKVRYVYQFEAKDIGRFYDFKIVDGPIIEVQGSYWHGDPRLYEQKDLNNVQLKTQKIDEYKKKWALSHGIPIYYVWEKDIKENPDKVMSFLKSVLYIEKKKNEKNKRHVNRLFQ